MDIKSFFLQKIMMSFFVSVTCITVAMASIGIVFEPTVRFGYDAFLSPLIFATIGTLPMLVKYSKKELSFKQTVIRNVLHLVLLEAVILSFLFMTGLLSSISLAVSLGISIGIIDLTVNVVLWIQDTRTAKEFNDALQTMQSAYSEGE
ncbi:MAG TPA: hypothetical protein VJ869_12240 [Sphaerochaeta sp.]|nr:hypothetical protein [Sphaerochaeta sp.]